LKGGLFQSNSIRRVNCKSNAVNQTPMQCVYKVFTRAGHSCQLFQFNFLKNWPISGARRQVSGVGCCRLFTRQISFFSPKCHGQMNGD
jgi:hypothetical protein